MGSRTTEIRIPPPFEEALRRHEREIMRFLMKTTSNREDALDLFQETWLRAYRAYPTLDSEAGLRPWLFRIASNLCRNRVRDLGRRNRVMADADHRCPKELEHPQAVEANASAGSAFDLKRAIAALPRRQGQALVMRKFVGLEYDEIAQALGCSQESVRASLYQALQKLRALR